MKKIINALAMFLICLSTITLSACGEKYRIEVDIKDGIKGYYGGSGTYKKGEKVDIYAMGDGTHEDYAFYKWNDGSRDSHRTITVNKDATYTAEFARMADAYKINNFGLYIKVNQKHDLSKLTLNKISITIDDKEISNHIFSNIIYDNNYIYGLPIYDYFNGSQVIMDENNYFNLNNKIEDDKNIFVDYSSNKNKENNISIQVTYSILKHNVDNDQITTNIINTSKTISLDYSKDLNNIAIVEDTKLGFSLCGLLDVESLGEYYYELEEFVELKK